MATLGRRKMSKDKRPKAPISVAGAGVPVNLIVNSIKVQPVATLGVQSSSLGTPIMREDFITSTGFSTFWCA